MLKKNQKMKSWRFKFHAVSVSTLVQDPLSLFSHKHSAAVRRQSRLLSICFEPQLTVSKSSTTRSRRNAKADHRAAVFTYCLCSSFCFPNQSSPTFIASEMTHWHFCLWERLDQTHEETEAFVFIKMWQTSVGETASKVNLENTSCL